MNSIESDQIWLCQASRSWLTFMKNLTRFQKLQMYLLKCLYARMYFQFFFLKSKIQNYRLSFFPMLHYRMGGNAGQSGAMSISGKFAEKGTSKN